MGLLQPCAGGRGRWAAGRRENLLCDQLHVGYGECPGFALVVDSVQCWWPPLCGYVCVITCFSMAVDPCTPENGSHASSHTSPLWDSSCLVPGPSMASALPLITTRVHNNNHGGLRRPQRFGWGEGLSGTSHQRLFRLRSPGLLWQESHLWARSSTIV